MDSDLGGIEPQLLWGHFNEIRKIPRCSKHEERAAEYVVAVARRLWLDCETDGAGNVVVRKGATPGREGSPSVLLNCQYSISLGQHRLVQASVTDGNGCLGAQGRQQPQVVLGELVWLVTPDGNNALHLLVIQSGVENRYA